MGFVPVAAAALAGGAAIYQGEKQRKQQKEALTRQEQAQKQAETAAISQQRKADMAFAAANQKSPDLASIMAGEQELSKQGIGSTMLTGPLGVPKSKLKLSNTSLLGS